MTSADLISRLIVYKLTPSIFSTAGGTMSWTDGYFEAGL